MLFAYRMSNLCVETLFCVLSKDLCLNICVQVLSKRVFLKCVENIMTASRGEKRKSNNDDKHRHGQEKRKPSTYVVGKNSTNNKVGK